MPRPRRCRWVGFRPELNYFGPKGAAGEVVLKVEELESLRLKDYLGVDQTEAAGMMGISQPTFNRILREARRRVAEALVDGKAIRVYGGDYRMAMRRFVCADCQNEWEEAYGTGRPQQCPNCGGTNIYRHPEDRGGHGPRRTL